MKINLKENFIYQQELNHAKQYQKKSILGKISFIIVILIWLIIFIPNILGMNISKTFESFAIWGAGIITFFGALCTLIFARCPKCRKVQPAGYGSAEVGEGIGLSYNKGFTPFRKRCCFCGTYLSVKQLEKDRRKQQDEAGINADETSDS